MNFLGVGGLEFVVIFAVALFIVGPKRLAEGVRTGRKYYTELKRHRDELTNLVAEAIDAEELKKDLTLDVGDMSGARKEMAGLKQDLTLDQVDIGIGPMKPVARSSSRAHFLDRGDGRINGQQIPAIDLNGSATASEAPADKGETEPERE